MRPLQHLASEGICLLWSGICWWEIAVTYQGSLFNLESFASHTQTSVPIWHLLPLLATMGPLVSEQGRKHGWRSQGIIEHDLCMLCGSAGQALFTAEPLCKPDTCPYTARSDGRVRDNSSWTQRSRTAVLPSCHIALAVAWRKWQMFAPFWRGTLLLTLFPLWFLTHIFFLEATVCGLWIF